MPKVQFQNKEVHVVEFIEYERGWGSKTFDVEYYDSKEEAIEKASSYNKFYNNKSSVPDWYVVAEYAGKTTI
jgi:hypothetical protein